jgi:hypothetical protein
MAAARLPAAGGFFLPWLVLVSVSSAYAGVAGGAAARGAWVLNRRTSLAAGH